MTDEERNLNDEDESEEREERRGRSDDRGDRRDRPRRSGGRMGSRRRHNNLRLEKPPIELYKDVDMLRRYLTDRGQIRPRRQTGLCARDQRRLAVAVKRARHLALLPYTSEHQRGD